MDREGTAINEKKAHVLVMTYPIQSHINPLLQFSKRLASKGVKVTLIIPSCKIKFPPNAATSSIKIAYITDGCQEGDNLSLDEYLQRFRIVVSQTLVEFVQEQLESELPPSTLVYDSAMFWALDIALQLGLRGASFFTQSCMVNAIYYLVHHGQLEIPVRDTFDSVPSLPVLKTSELPTLTTTDNELYPLLMSLCVNQFSELERAKSILINTFFELEEDVSINSELHVAISR